MFSSVRTRLTLWYTAILGLILTIFAVAVNGVITYRFHSELDASLASAATVISVSLRHEIQEHHGRAPGEAMFAGVLKTIHAASFPLQAIVVYAKGRLVASKPGVEGEIESPPQPAGAVGWCDVRSRSGARLRLVSRSVFIPEAGVDYLIAVAEPIDRTQSQISFLRGVLLIAVPLALVLAAGAGYLLARKSLAPVAAMSRQVNRITAGKLGQRLTVANSQDELGDLATTFNGLLRRLDEAFEQQRRFMADASHELRTPIAVSRTAAEVMLSSPSRAEEEYREALGIVAAQMQRLTRVVNDMFTLALADAGAYTVQRHRFYLNDLLEEALLAARVLAAPRNVAVAGGPFEDAPYEGDEDLIRQLLLILLDNAVKYTPAGGRVDVRLEPGYIIRVADTGIGIAEDVQARIFDRFFRVDKARSRSAPGGGGGAGLGLAIANWIATVHGGKLEVESSSPGEGSVFRVTLPLNPSPTRQQPG